MVEPVERFNGALWLALGVLGLGLVLAALVQVWSAWRRCGGCASTGCRCATAKRSDWTAISRQRSRRWSTNSMRVLAQNAEVVARARTQAGNLAHALKTPLSVLANARRRQGRTSWHTWSATRSAWRAQQVDYHLARAQCRGHGPHARAAARLLRPVIDGWCA